MSDEVERLNKLLLERDIENNDLRIELARLKRAPEAVAWTDPKTLEAFKTNPWITGTIWSSQRGEPASSVPLYATPPAPQPPEPVDDWGAYEDELLVVHSAPAPQSCDHDWEKTTNDLVMWVCSKCKEARPGDKPGYTKPTPQPPVLDTTVSKETQATLDAIDGNIRAAAVAASTTFFGAPQPLVNGDVLRLALVRAATKLDAVAAIIRAENIETSITLAGAHSIAFVGAREAREALSASPPEPSAFDDEWNKYRDEEGNPRFDGYDKPAPQPPVNGDVWRYSINYGPDGEENWANLITPEGKHVANIRTHHAMRIVAALSASPPQGGSDE